jgi:hypothetical protein
MRILRQLDRQDRTHFPFLCVAFPHFSSILLAIFGDPSRSQIYEHRALEFGIRRKSASQDAPNSLVEGRGDLLQIAPMSQ